MVLPVLVTREFHHTFTVQAIHGSQFGSVCADNGHVVFDLIGKLGHDCLLITAESAFRVPPPASDNTGDSLYPA